MAHGCAWVGLWPVAELLRGSWPVELRATALAALALAAAVRLRSYLINPKYLTPGIRPYALCPVSQPYFTRSGVNSDDYFVIA